MKKHSEGLSREELEELEKLNTYLRSNYDFDMTTEDKYNEALSKMSPKSQFALRVLFKTRETRWWDAFFKSKSNTKRSIEEMMQLAWQVHTGKTKFDEADLPSACRAMASFLIPKLKKSDVSIGKVGIFGKTGSGFMDVQPEKALCDFAFAFFQTGRSDDKGTSLIAERSADAYVIMCSGRGDTYPIPKDKFMATEMTAIIHHTFSCDPSPEKMRKLRLAFRAERQPKSKNAVLEFHIASMKRGYFFTPCEASDKLKKIAKIDMVMEAIFVHNICSVSATGLRLKMAIDDDGNYVFIP